MDKLFGLLGISRRAGHALVGFDAAADGIRKGKAYVAVLASDVSPKTAKEIRFAAESKRVAVLSVSADMLQLGRALGYQKPVGVCAVSDKGLALAIQKAIESHKEEHSL